MRTKSRSQYWYKPPKTKEKKWYVVWHEFADRVRPEFVRARSEDEAVRKYQKIYSTTAFLIAERVEEYTWEDTLPQL